MVIIIQILTLIHQSHQIRIRTQTVLFLLYGIYSQPVLPADCILSNDHTGMALASYPGSGVTWLRHLIHQTTGYWTGSVKTSEKLSKLGWLGEALGMPNIYQDRQPLLQLTFQNVMTVL